MVSARLVGYDLFTYSASPRHYLSEGNPNEESRHETEAIFEE
jgi:hypothetical protein